MRRLPWLLFVFAGAVGLAQPVASNDVAAILQRQTQELFDALVPGTASVWERYLDAAVSVTTEDGEVLHKSQLVAQVKPFPEGVSGSIKVTDFQVTVHGTVAVTTHVEDESENYHGHQLHCQYRTTDTWVQTGAGWRLLASQILALRTDPPAIELTAQQAEAYVGHYSLSPGIAYDIRLKDGQLEGQRTGRKPEVLRAEVVDVLFVPGQPRYRKVIQRDAAGRITGLVERREAWELPWVRMGAPLFAQPPAKTPARLDEEPSFVNEGIVNAPVSAVWNVWTTGEGYKSLGVAMAEVDLRIGGLIRSHYSATGSLGDEDTIENRILTYEPRRMIAIQINRTPKSFPFHEAWKNTWTVITLTDLGNRTHLRIASMGYGLDEESKAMRQFFEQGNAATIKELQDHFNAK